MYSTRLDMSNITTGHDLHDGEEKPLQSDLDET